MAHNAYLRRQVLLSTVLYTGRGESLHRQFGFKANRVTYIYKVTLPESFSLSLLKTAKEFVYILLSLLLERDNFAVHPSSLTEGNDTNRDK